MELIKVQLGRAIWLLDTQELNPRGVALYPDLYFGFGKRYQFATMPKPEEIHAGGSVYFKQGRFFRGTVTIAVDLELHNDGLVANTRDSTETAHEFLHDVVIWLQEQLGIVYPPNIVKKRVYRSELIVSMNPKLDVIAEKIGKFSALVSEASAKPSVLIGMQFGSQEIPAAFYIERKVVSNTPLTDNEFIANAWMHTSRHIELLRQFEEIMGA